MKVSSVRIGYPAVKSGKILCKTLETPQVTLQYKKCVLMCSFKLMAASFSFVKYFNFHTFSSILAYHLRYYCEYFLNEVLNMCRTIFKGM